MTRTISSGNCWQAFLSCMLNVPLSHVGHCSTVHEDWLERSQKFLAQYGLFYIEVPPSVITPVTPGCLVGAYVDGVEQPHIVVAKVVEDGSLTRYGFVVEHDPSRQWEKGTPIMPKSVVILCKLIQ